MVDFLIFILRHTEKYKNTAANISQLEKQLGEKLVQVIITPIREKRIIKTVKISVKFAFFICSPHKRKTTIKDAAKARLVMIFIDINCPISIIEDNI